MKIERVTIIRIELDQNEALAVAAACHAGATTGNGLSPGDIKVATEFATELHTATLRR